MKANKTYSLKYMTDLFDIPEDRFEDFLIDLRKWHKHGRGIEDLFKSVEKALGKESPEPFMSMKWTDDGIHDNKIVIKATDASGTGVHTDGSAKAKLKGELAQEPEGDNNG